MPLKLLEEITNGDGGLVALLTALMLYEWYLTAKYRPNSELRIVDVENHLSQDLANDCNCTITSDQARAFWHMYRHGLLYAGMPKQNNELPAALLTGDVSFPIVPRVYNEKEFLIVNPWQFMEFVFRTWDRHLELLSAITGNLMMSRVNIPLLIQKENPSTTVEV
jgi:hypothetical protein